MSKTIQKGPKKFKMVQYGPNASKNISQNERSWCDSSWGNNSQKEP